MTPLSQPLQAVVTLFEGPLAGVRFADIDAAGLSKLAAEVASAAAELEQHEAKLVELRQALAQRQEALQTLAQQALAYARIYAEGDEALSAQLNDIALPRGGKPRKQVVGKATSANSDGSEKPVEAAETAAAPAATGQQQNSAARGPSRTNPDQDASENIDEEAGEEPLKTKPSYARPKVKRRLGRAATQGDSV